MGSSGGAVGNGIYWADNIEASKRKAKNHGVTLQASVELGVSLLIDDKRQLRSYGSYELQSSGCDSIIITCLNGTEYVVFNPSQVSNITVCEGSVDLDDEYSSVKHNSFSLIRSNNPRQVQRIMISQPTVVHIVPSMGFFVTPRCRGLGHFWL